MHLLKSLSSHGTQVSYFIAGGIVASLLFWGPFKKKQADAIDQPPQSTLKAPPGTAPGASVVPTRAPGSDVLRTGVDPSPQQRQNSGRPAQISQHSEEQHEQDNIQVNRCEEQNLVTDALAGRLMTVADRFTCTTEMATLLAMMSVGKPKCFLYWDREWDAATRRSVHFIHSALKKGCHDDIEFALKLYTAWSEAQYDGRPLAPTWALRQIWQPRRIPQPSFQMKERLGPRVVAFRKESVKVLSYAHACHLVDQYGLEDIADAWLKEMQSALLQAQREVWTSAFFIHHGLFARIVEPERERLLDNLINNKRVVERRPINFDLLDRVRIILAHSLASQPSSHLPTPYQIHIKPEWEEWLQQPKPSPMALARFITQQTRGGDTGEFISKFAYQRLFLDQSAPIGSRYSCKVTHVAPGGSFQVELVRRVSEPRAIQEGFRGGERMAAGGGPRVHEVNIQTHDEADRAAQVSREGLSASWPHKTFGYLQVTDKQYQAEDTLVAEVVDYSFDDPALPMVILQPVPDLEPFDAFTEQYQVGDVVTVVVRAYDEHPDDPLISLAVQEPVSCLEVLMEPEQLSFNLLDCAIKEIPLGTTLEVVVDDIDENRRRIYLSLLPFMENHLSALLQEHERTDGTYQVEAVIKEVFQDSFLLMLGWSQPTRGLIYAVQVPTNTLPEPQRIYRAGEACILRLTFSDQSSSEDMRRLPAEMKKVIDLQQEPRCLYWKQQRLYYNGQMSYRLLNKFLALTSDRSCHYVLRHLYLLSHQFSAEVIAVETSVGPEELHLAKASKSAVVFDGLKNLREGAPAEDLNPEDIIEVDVKRREISRSALQPGTHPIMNYQVGDRAKGRVTGVKEFGAFVELEPGVSGLVHKSKMWGYVADARDAIFPNQEVEILVLNVNLDRGNLELSMQLPERDPLLQYQVGDTVTGKVTDVKEFGAFVELEPGVSGLVHKSKMWGYVADARDAVQLDDEVTVLILDVDRDKRWLELSMQVSEHDPLLRYQPGDSVRGKVTDVKEFGAFVELEPGASGLVHRSDIGEYITDARRVVNVGDEVEVLVIRVDMEKRRLLLSMKEI